MSLSERDTQIQLAACRGVLIGLSTNEHLGLAAKRYGYIARTFTGDVFESSLEWARQEKQNLKDDIEDAYQCDCFEKTCSWKCECNVCGCGG